MNKTEKLFKIDFMTKINYVPNFKHLKKQLEFNTEIEQKPKMKFNFKFLYIMPSLILILGIVFMLLFTNRTIYVQHGDSVVDFSNKAEVVAYYDYIFIAKVGEEVTTKLYDGTGTDIPYTEYTLNVVDFVKGEGNLEETLYFYGGYDKLNNLYIYDNNQDLPVVGEYYIYFSNRVSTDSTNQRMEAGDFTVSIGQQMILLNGYDANFALSEQNDEINAIIESYLQYIN